MPTPDLQADNQLAVELAADGIIVRRVPCPNWGPRPPAATTDTIVIHYTALALKETLELLTNPAREASTHFVIDRQGELFQLVSTTARAWHAGSSQLKGQPDVNSRSIGIDLVFVPERHDRYTNHQYRVLTLLCRSLMRLLPILPDQVVGHEQVAMPPGRKQDPGPRFDWARLYRALAPAGDSNSPTPTATSTPGTSSLSPPSRTRS